MPESRFSSNEAAPSSIWRHSMKTVQSQFIPSISHSKLMMWVHGGEYSIAMSAFSMASCWADNEKTIVFPLFYYAYYVFISKLPNARYPAQIPINMSSHSMSSDSISTSVAKISLRWSMSSKLMCSLSLN